MVLHGIALLALAHGLYLARHLIDVQYSPQVLFDNTPCEAKSALPPECPSCDLLQHLYNISSMLKKATSILIPQFLKKIVSQEKSRILASS